ncbi:hypothetical protein [Kurthia sp. Dielmo]|uniref:hypothetical protein n=1 Tax=Kurthia sp. Dielmo TaxID=1033738 RepID=UPI001123755D|nr:hypothetical protein [Kurthia sp. Dielmo]
MEDKLREEKQQSPFDHIVSYGTAALSLGFGAAVFNKEGGLKMVANASTVLKRATGDLQEQFAQVDRSNFTTKDLKNLYNRAFHDQTGGFKGAKKYIDEGHNAPSLRVDGSSGVLNSLRQVENKLATFENDAKNGFIERTVLRPLANKHNDRYKFEAVEDKKRLDQLIYFMNKNISNKMAIYKKADSLKIANKMGGRSQIDSIYEELKSIKTAKEKSYTVDKEFDQKILSDLREKAYDINALERTHGTIRKPDKMLSPEQMVTVKDVLDNPELYRESMLSRRVKGSKEPQVMPAIQYLQEKMQDFTNRGEGERFGQLLMDRSVLRRDIKTNEVYSLKDFHDLVANPIDEFGTTMIGKILKVFDVKKRFEQPSFLRINPGPQTMDALLASSEGSKTASINNTYFRLYDRTYRQTNDGLEEVEALRDSYLVSKNGTVRSLYGDMIGDRGHRTTDSKWRNALDIGKTSGITFFDMIGNISEYGGSNTNPRVAIESLVKNGLDNLSELATAKQTYKDAAERLKVVNASTTVTDEEKAALYAMRDAGFETIDKYVEQSRTVYRFYDKNAQASNNDTIRRLLNTGGFDKSAEDMLKMLNQDDESLLQNIVTGYNDFNKDNSAFLNKNVLSTMRRYVENPKTALDHVSIKNDSQMTGKLFGTENRSSNFIDELRLEIEKEAYMRQARHVRTDDGQVNIRGLSDLIGGSGAQYDQVRNAQNVADFATFQSLTGVYKDATDNKSVQESADMAEQAIKLFARREGDDQRNDISERLVNNVLNKTNKFETSYDIHMQQENIVEGFGNDAWIHMNKAISPMDLLRNLNDKEFRKSFVKQFVAGRNDMENVTTATMMPYFFLNRLNDPLEKIGVGLSSEYRGSSVDLMRGIVMKRALPIAMGITGYNYMNDFSQATTGVGITESFLSNAANIDLGMRGVADITGVSDWLKDERALNPIAQYLFGEEYMDKDERADYYQNGYSAMRKGRWWSFGSLNEFRGSKVQYWQPNLLRRVTSDYHDESLYDGFLDKWSHSWMPTPTNPLSPLNALMDPYWLENKHYEDRPYMVSGKMFTEETPWGPLLNATVGNVLKPQIQMHQERLNSDYVDVRAIIERRNRETMERANGENRNLARFKDGAIEAVNFTSYDAPTESQRIVRINQSNGQSDVTAMNYGAFTGVTTGEAYMRQKAISEDAAGGGATGEFLTGVAEGTNQRLGNSALMDYGSKAGGVMDLMSSIGNGGEISVGTGLSFADRAEIEGAGGNVVAKLFSTLRRESNESMNIVSDLNYNTLMNTRSYRPSNSHVREGGVVTTESLYKASARFGDGILDNKEAISDLKGLSGGDDMIGELAYSARFITGIYGYGSFLAAGGSAKNKVSDASDMTSPIRSFWDANLGGVGGNYLEIFRRFIPSNNFLENNFNPLMNTMPDWMPDKYRFGDPYTALPKGEMRMPGKGYESLNELHSDQYGRYGAFDRYKILSDISPGSEEYKIWRDIAKETVSSPELKEEMDRINDRVKKQNENYDFFDYQFLGKSTRKEKVQISEVIDNNFFKVAGDDKTYRLAGVSVTNKNKKDDALSLTDGTRAIDQFLAPGQEVVISRDKDTFDGTDQQSGAVSAALFINGKSVGKELMDMGYAEKRGDTSAAAADSVYSATQIARGKAYEAIAHLPIPVFQQKFMKVRNPLESYKQELVYGTNYTSWNRPIDSILLPAFERSLMSDGEVLIGIGAAVANHLTYKMTDDKASRAVANVAMALSNRGAFIGGFLAKGLSIPNSQIRKAAFVGAGAQVAGYLYTRQDQPLQEGVMGGLLGMGVGHLLKDIGIRKGGAIGAATGFLFGGMSSSALSDDAYGFGNKYIPERTRETWDMREYYDRLEYVKYSGLFEKAARKAKHKEHMDIGKLVKDYEKQREENRKVNEQLGEYRQIIMQAYAPGSQRRDQLLNEIDGKMNVLKESEFNIAVGDYAKSALIYKQAMDSTIYGLKDDATWSQIVRATPTNERDHFMAFMKEANPKKRKEILKYVSPYEAKVLKTAWGMETEKQESNSSYFEHHRMPGATWSGWRPDKDLSDIQVKTIHNEGRLLSDFGFFESQLRDPDVIRADQASPNQPGSGFLQTKMAMIATLKGYGLTNVNVNVEPKKESGMEVIANVANITQYNIHNALTNLL